jgi:hypothetical protein
MEVGGGGGGRKLFMHTGAALGGAPKSRQMPDFAPSNPVLFCSCSPYHTTFNCSSHQPSALLEPKYFLAVVQGCL